MRTAQVGGSRARRGALQDQNIGDEVEAENAEAAPKATKVAASNPPPVRRSMRNAKKMAAATQEVWPHSAASTRVTICLYSLKRTNKNASSNRSLLLYRS